MSAMPVLVIGFDPSWRARMQRLLATRQDLDWLGAFAPATTTPSAAPKPALIQPRGDQL